ncbi:MAG: class I SAM-dependent methyltransferase, partial [Phycisphaerae bacterium]|nr:class I SAM-dependent methyltransferase [Phycisphaerae bacterium]
MWAIICACLPAVCGLQIAHAGQGADILKSAGVQGGLVVHVGCGTGEVTADLVPNAGFVVRGLDSDAANISKARKCIADKGLYGRVSVGLWDGKTLPYADGLVNCVIVDSDLPGAAGEIIRVLAPGGVGIVKESQARG